MTNPIKSNDYGTIKRELRQRGAWQDIVSSRLPNKTLAFPVTRELFYVLDSPKLAAWAQYDNDKDFATAFGNLTVERLKQQPPVEAKDGQNRISSRLI